MRKIAWIALSAIIVIASCSQPVDKSAATLPDIAGQKKSIASMLDSFNIAAANADFNGYFSFFTDSAVFIGTDATEYWTKPTFMVWAKPYFDKKKTWDFKAVKRNIYFGSDPNLAWFDELLNTQMKICRGSGVVVRQNGKWKVREYILSMTIPNERINDALKAKAPIEDSLLKAWQ